MLSRPTYSAHLHAHRSIQILPRCAGARQSNRGVVPLRPSSCSLFFLLLICLTTLACALRSWSQHTSPSSIGESRTPRSTFICIHSSSSVSNFTTVSSAAESSRFMVCHWCWRQHWRQSQHTQLERLLRRCLRCAVLLWLGKGMYLGVRRTGWWAKALKPLGEWEMRDAHCLAQLRALDPIIGFIIEELEV
jgi:hypothetical protein